MSRNVNRIIGYFLFFLITNSILGQNFDEDSHLLGRGIISTPLNERDFTLSPDKSEIYFTRSNFNNTSRAILTSKIIDGKFSEPTVASFSGIFNDLEPFFSPNGDKIYFSSNRNISQTEEKKDFDIWFVERVKNGKWSKAIRLSESINSDKDEFYPAITNSGNLYFTTSRENGIGSEDIFISKLENGIYQEAKPLDSNINLETYEFNAFVNPDETLIIYSSYGRDDGLGGGDLYYSCKDDRGNWKKAKNLGPEVNSKSLDYCPYYDANSQTLYYTSNESKDYAKPLTTAILEQTSLGIYNGYGNLYKIKKILK